jgi:hypothetical protein
VLWVWILSGLLGWWLCAVSLAAVAGRGIRVSDGRCARSGDDQPLTTADLPWDMWALVAKPSPAGSGVAGV